MEAIVLAGGLGTRLKSVISDIPKPMAPIEGIPFLHYILEYLNKNGITKVILSVGYKWEVIQAYFGSSFQNIELVYSVENEPLGTGGAIKQAIKQTQMEKVFIINGDTFFNVNLQQLKLHLASKITLSLKPMYNFDRYGCVTSDKNGKVTSFIEKSYQAKGNINGGVYLVSQNIFDGFILEEKFSFENFLEKNIDSLSIYAQIFDTYFIDIGIPSDYEKAQDEMKNWDYP